VAPSILGVDELETFYGWFKLVASKPISTFRN